MCVCVCMLTYLTHIFTHIHLVSFLHTRVSSVLTHGRWENVSYPNYSSAPLPPLPPTSSSGKSVEIIHHRRIPSPGVQKGAGVRDPTNPRRQTHGRYETQTNNQANTDITSERQAIRHPERDHKEDRQPTKRTKTSNHTKRLPSTQTDIQPHKQTSNHTDRQTDSPSAQKRSPVTLKVGSEIDHDDHSAPK